ncbi:hypothetical protein JOF29_002682 [Kribbella aluminosa]|uniref:Uncharacterized protein n=1 Tax=Kribbella aluminosa TaxID=416017 RepID=A0ABS4UJ06_9ACTN|nr:hypothetical protein [Kribbella aluminosa]
MLAITHHQEVPVTFRSGGTSLSGQASTTGRLVVRQIADLTTGKKKTGGQEAPHDRRVLFSELSMRPPDAKRELAASVCSPSTLRSDAFDLLRWFHFLQRQFTPWERPFRSWQRQAGWRSTAEHQPCGRARTVWTAVRRGLDRTVLQLINLRDYHSDRWRDDMRPTPDPRPSTAETVKRYVPASAPATSVLRVASPDHAIWLDAAAAPPAREAFIRIEAGDNSFFSQVSTEPHAGSRRRPRRLLRRLPRFHRRRLWRRHNGGTGYASPQPGLPAPSNYGQTPSTAPWSGASTYLTPAAGNRGRPCIPRSRLPEGTASSSCLRGNVSRVINPSWLTFTP